MTRQEFDAMPQAQRRAMKDLASRSGLDWDRLLLDSYAPTVLSSYVGIPNFHGMFVGIEVDGFTHS